MILYAAASILPIMMAYYGVRHMTLAKESYQFRADEETLRDIFVNKMMPWLESQINLLFISAANLASFYLLKTCLGQR